MARHDLIFRIKRHEGLVIAVVGFLILFYYGESWSDASNCSIKNPNIDCTQRGHIDISQIYSYNYTQTTGFGTHYINNIPVPEFRGNSNNIYGNYIHAVCDLGNTTCEWHLDKYPALGDFPFGFVLHLSDFLTIQPFPINLSEDLWQVVIWGFIISAFYLIVKEVEERFFP